MPRSINAFNQFAHKLLPPPWMQPSSSVAELSQKETCMTHFVLVHVAWHNACCWERVIPVLRDAGHSVTAVALPKQPGVGAEVCAATIEKAVSRPADTIVVAHSAAGLVAPPPPQRARGARPGPG